MPSSRKLGILQRNENTSSLTPKNRVNASVQGRDVTNLNKPNTKHYASINHIRKAIYCTQRYLNDTLTLMCVFVCVCVCVCVCVHVCVWEEGNFTHHPPCWFPLNNLETIKAVTLAFCSIQYHFIRDVRAKFGIPY